MTETSTIGGDLNILEELEGMTLEQAIKIGKQK